MLGGYTDTRIFILLLRQNDWMLTRKRPNRLIFFLSKKNVEYTCQTLGNLNMGNFEKGDNLPRCLRQKCLPLYTIHGVMLHCWWHVETFILNE